MAGSLACRLAAPLPHSEDPSSLLIPHPCSSVSIRGCLLLALLASPAVRLFLVPSFVVDRRGRPATIAPDMLEPILPFHPPVVVAPHVVQELCARACEGYETKHKRETFGFLYGTLSQDHRLSIRRAAFYRGGCKTRTGISFADWPAVRRVLARRAALARKHGMRFLGGFHSHVEIAGKVFQGLSDSDRRSLRRDWHAALEAVVFVWQGRSRPRPSLTSITAREPVHCYNFRIRVYAKRRAGIRAVRLTVPGAAGIIPLTL